MSTDTSAEMSEDNNLLYLLGPDLKERSYALIVCAWTVKSGFDPWQGSGSRYEFTRDLTKLRRRRQRGRQKSNRFS